MDAAQQILDLIAPFVKEGKILPRTYAQIEDGITDFVFLMQADTMIACAGLKHCQEGGAGEIYALAVSKAVQNQGISVKLLDKIMQKAATDKLSKVFALTKHNAEWFLKQGFAQVQIGELPKKRQVLFDHQRNSSIFIKEVSL